MINRKDFTNFNSFLCFTANNTPQLLSSIDIYDENLI